MEPDGCKDGTSPRKVQEVGLSVPEVVVAMVGQRRHRRKVQQVSVPMALETLGTQWEVAGNWSAKLHGTCAEWSHLW